MSDRKAVKQKFRQLQDSQMREQMINSSQINLKEIKFKNLTKAL